MYRDELDAYMRNLPGVKVKELRSRNSYWRADGTRFCKIEGTDQNLSIVFTDLTYDRASHRLTNSEPDGKGRLKLRLVNPSSLESAESLIRERYK